MQQFDSAIEARIRSVMRSCGQQAKQMAAAGLEVDLKAPGDFVTQVDRLLDQQLSAEFSALFPDDGLITEENNASIQRFLESHERFWCIDPVDGTQDFIETGKDYAVMVGLLEGQQPIGGWVYEPEADHLFFGGPEWGLWQQIGGAPFQTCTPQAVALGGRVIIGARDQANYGATLALALPEIELWARPGSFGLKIIDVILGRAGLLVYFNGRVKLWDTVGPFALARAAGLVCCDLAGDPIGYSADRINPATLAHRQPIILGWPNYVEAYRERLQSALAGLCPQ
jgi:3'(2'), 5'-bisphosphate nucleotidase